MGSTPKHVHLTGGLVVVKGGLLVKASELEIEKSGVDIQKPGRLVQLAIPSEVINHIPYNYAEEQKFSPGTPPSIGPVLYDRHGHPVVRMTRIEVNTHLMDYQTNYGAYHYVAPGLRYVRVEGDGIDMERLHRVWEGR